MNRALWVAQILLALVFLAAGLTKLLMSSAALEAAMPAQLSVTFLRILGVCEVLGAFGMILPGLLRIRPWLTPLAAAGFVLIMIGAVYYTVVLDGFIPALFPLIVGIVSIFVVYGRWRVAPLSSSPRQPGASKIAGNA
jgi:DoxX-like family